jgi:hypothetical protein
MELRRILMAAALVTTVGGSSLLAEPSARRTGGGGGCPNYVAYHNPTCIDESSRPAWCDTKLQPVYAGCVATSTGSDHTCSAQGEPNNDFVINCKVVPQ